MQLDYETLKFERQGAIGVLSLNRPERLNAMNGTMIEELLDFFSALPKFDETRVLVLRGEGRAFCSGMDLGFWLAQFGKPADSGAVQYFYQKVQQPISAVMLAMRHVPQPIIASVRGGATGGGFSLSLAADVRIAGESARFNAAYVKVGTSGTDVGSSYFLPRIIGFSRAAEYLMTGRFIDAVTAERIGLVSRVVADDYADKAALELAEEMIACSPLGLRMTKEVLNLSVDAPSMEAAMAIENRTQVMCLLTEDAKEGPRAFLEKRKPAWRNR